MDMEVPHFNALAGGDPLLISFTSQKLERLFYEMLKTAQLYLHSSGFWTIHQNVDGRTVRQTDSYLLASIAVSIASNAALRAMRQCGRAIKTANIIINK